MTTEQLVDELRRKLGNRTDIADDRYVQWLNWAMLDLCGFHRQRVFPSVWFHELEDSILVSLSPVTNTVDTATDNTITLDTSESDVDGYFSDTVIKITGYDETAAGQSAPTGLLDQTRLILSYDDNRVATVDVAWDVNPDQYTEYTIYRKGFRFGIDIDQNSKTDIYAILRLETAREGNEIEHVAWESLVNSDPMTLGAPGRYARHGDRILFDSAPEEALALRLWVYRYPRQLSATEPSEATVLPDQWDEVVLLGALWRGFESLMEPDRAMEAKEQYVNAATNKNSTYAVEAPHVERGIRVRRNY